jgi:hypothetical protein
MAGILEFVAVVAESTSHCVAATPSTSRPVLFLSILGYTIFFFIGSAHFYSQAGKLLFSTSLVTSSNSPFSRAVRFF